MPNRALLRLARDLSDAGFRGVVRVYYVRRGFGVLSVEFIIYRRPSNVRRFWVRVKRAFEGIPSLIAAVIIGFLLVLIVRFLL